MESKLEDREENEIALDIIFVVRGVLEVGGRVRVARGDLRLTSRRHPLRCFVIAGSWSGLIEQRLAFCSIRSGTDQLHQSSEPHGVAMLQVATGPTFQSPFRIAFASHCLSHAILCIIRRCFHFSWLLTEMSTSLTNDIECLPYLSNLPILSCLVPSRMRTIHSSVRRLDYVGDYP